MKQSQLSQRIYTVVLFAVFISGSLYAQETIDYRMVDKFREEGFKHSQVMEIVSYMTDVFGPRLSNSPSCNRSTEWANERFESYGIDVEIQAFGLG